MSHSGSDISDTISGFRNERLLSAARNETKELLKINTTHANQSVPNSKPTTRQVLAATAQKENVATAKKQYGSNHIQHVRIIVVNHNTLIQYTSRRDKSCRRRNAMQNQRA